MDGILREDIWEDRERDKTLGTKNIKCAKIYIYVYIYISNIID